MKTLQLNVFFNLNQNETQLVGKLTQVNQTIYFEYGTAFIETGLELSPFKLPLKAGIQTDPEKTFFGLPGLFNDSLPDGWGLLLMDRYFRQQGIEPIAISPLERLAYIGKRALGALSYEPSQEINYQWQSQLTLEILATDCEKILHGDDGEVLPELIIAGGSPGGARPKVIIAYNHKTKKLLSGVANTPDDFNDYLIKFSTMTALNDIAEVEYAYSLMAKDCGINMPDTLLFDAGRFGKAFGIERFDKNRQQRTHVHTLSGLLHANYRIPNLDYIDYLKASWLLTQNSKEVEQAYRRMVFNVLTHNRDDHSKNFAFILKGNQWQLSPAYDLTCSSGMAGEHTMTIAGEGANPNKEHLLLAAKKVDLDKDFAKQSLEEMQDVVNQWSTYADRAGVDKTTKKRVQKILDNIGI